MILGGPIRIKLSINKQTHAMKHRPIPLSDLKTLRGRETFIYNPVKRGWFLQPRHGSEVTPETLLAEGYTHAVALHTPIPLEDFCKMSKQLPSPAEMQQLVKKDYSDEVVMTK